MEGLNKNIPKEAIIDKDDNIEKKEKLISDIEINGVKVECIIKSFEYPEHIQRETGILGYERKIISDKELLKYGKSILENNFEIGLDEANLTDLDSLVDFMKKINSDQRTIYEKNQREYRENNADAFENSGRKKYDEYMNDPERAKKYEFFKSNFSEKFMFIILEALSNGKYPNECFTHQMNFYVDDDKKEAQHDDFVKDKLFLQKIYDVDAIKRQIDRGIPSKKIFDYSNYPWGKSGVSIFNKETMEKVGSGLGDLAKPEYYDGLKNGKFFAYTPKSGFNVGVMQFFRYWNCSHSNQDIFFGFEMEKSSFFYKYLEKALSLYIRYDDIVDNKQYIERESGIYGLIEEIALIDSNIGRIIKNPENQYYLNRRDRQFRSDLAKIVKKSIEDIGSRFNIDVDNYIKDKSDDLTQCILHDSEYSLEHDGLNANNCELRLPVFIGSDEIPQLSWGYAKYAHCMSPKGLNFFEFKHADHLPQKQID